MAFEKRIWVDVPDPNSPPDDAIALDAKELNRIEEGIEHNEKEIDKRLLEKTYGLEKQIHEEYKHTASPLFLRDFVCYIRRPEEMGEPDSGTYTYETYITSSPDKKMQYFIIRYYIHTAVGSTTKYYLYSFDLESGEVEPFSLCYNFKDGSSTHTDYVFFPEGNAYVDRDRIIKGARHRNDASNGGCYIYDVRRGDNSFSNIPNRTVSTNGRVRRILCKDNIVYLLTASGYLYRFTLDELFSDLNTIYQPSAVYSDFPSTTGLTGVFGEHVYMYGQKIIEQDDGSISLEYLGDHLVGCYDFDPNSGLCISRETDSIRCIYNMDTSKVETLYYNPFYDSSNGDFINRHFIIDGYLYLIVGYKLFKVKIT